MLRVRLVIFLAILLSCAGCGSRGASAPAVTPAPPPQPAEPMPVEPLREPPATTKSVEETPVLPDLPADPPAALSQPPAESTAAPAATADLLHESFADAAGSIRWNRDGVKSFEGPLSDRTIYFFNGPPEDGPLVMRIVEDNAIKGPDEQPGVLALTWQEIPPKLSYSGITYLGGRTGEDRLTLPPLKLAKTAEDLRPFRLKFRHKAVNESRTEPISLSVGCRFEPMLGDSFAKRVDLGNFTATGEWGTFDMSLAEGTNAEALLAAIANENPTSFKVVWAQAGKLADYQAGDTLLIDDIVISSDMPE